MSPTTTTTGERTQHDQWLAENGPAQLESLFRTIVFQPAIPIVVTDDKGVSHDASMGAGRILGLPRARVPGRALADLVVPASQPLASKLLSDLAQAGVKEGILPLATPDGSAHPVAFTALANVLPGRHVVAFREPAAPNPESPAAQSLDCALYLLDTHGCVTSWYAGAERIYGYPAVEAAGLNFLGFYLEEEERPAEQREELVRAARKGHMATEGWQQRKDGSRFWANSITMALRDQKSELRGFARAVRDFTDRHARDESIRAANSAHPVPMKPSATGVVTGEFDKIPEANITFLNLLGYTRQDLDSGQIVWPDLTPAEYAPLDELAHEESLRFGASSPIHKELLRKDGTRVPVMVTTAVLNLCPFRWIALVTDLTGAVDDEPAFEPVEPDTAPHFEEFIGTSSSMRRMMAQVALVAPTNATALVLGETGTGKELVARAIHRLSPRCSMPFISLNCAAIPTGLLESELFGYERGAFTGALGQKIGRFEMAHRGTLFLDEVGDIPLDLQPKLLRALQEKSFERLGGTRTIPIDVRLVAATNRDLGRMMSDKLFRPDLYYRLKVFPVNTPALRDHPEDIPALVRHFIRKYAKIMGRTVDKVPTDTMKALVSWTWPGNVRELENFIERCVILSPGTTLMAPLAELRDETHAAEESALLEDIEYHHIVKIFRETGGVISTAAARLGIPRTTLNAMMKKLNITRADL